MGHSWLHRVCHKSKLWLKHLVDLIFFFGFIKLDNNYKSHLYTFPPSPPPCCSALWLEKYVDNQYLAQYF